MSIKVPKPISKFQTKVETKSLPIKWMKDIEEEKFDWLMPGVPIGEVTIIDGDPKAGKSWITFSWASAVSNGKYDLLPGWTERGPGKVLIFSLENNSSKVIKPRLRHLKANMDNIGIIDTYVTLDEVNILSIEKTISEVKPDLVIFDPISLYVGGSLDMNQANKVRQPMQRLQILASKYGCAVVVVRHLNKGNSSKAMYRGQGSIDFIAAVRSAFIAVTNPDNQEERALHYNGGNICKELRPIGYVIQDTDDGVGVLKWTDVPPQFSLERALAYQIPGEDEGSEKADATTLLRVMLEKGEMLSTDIKEVAKGEGITEKQLRTSREKLGILVRWEGRGRDLITYWRLPEKGQEEIVSSDSNNSEKESQLCPDESIYALPYTKGQSWVKTEPNPSIANNFQAMPSIGEMAKLKPERANLEGDFKTDSNVQLCPQLCPSMDNGHSSEVIQKKDIYIEKSSALPSSYIEGIAEIERANLEPAKDQLSGEEDEVMDDAPDQTTKTALSIIEAAERKGQGGSPSIKAAKGSYERTGMISQIELEILRANLSFWGLAIIENEAWAIR